MRSKHVHREPMVSDVIFKAVYGNTTQESKDALIEMLNLAIREDRETAEIFLRMEKAYARDKGLAEGRAEGLKQGQQQGLQQGQQQGRIESQREIATKLKAMGMTVNNISEATGLSEEEIRDL